MGGYGAAALAGAAPGASGRMHFAAPRAPHGVRRERNSNKHKRLFLGEEGSLKDGDRVTYKTAKGVVLLAGVVRIDPEGQSGILCACCDKVVSCSAFEAHAGRGARRAPYDNIFTEAGVSLRQLAASLPERDGAGGTGMTLRARR